jgi:hypothetical protein
LISFKHKGSFGNAEKFLNRAKRPNIRFILERYAVQGVTQLTQATPKDTSNTAHAWRSEITTGRDGYRIYWTNSNIVDGVPLVILLQYGHGTRGGTFVEGRDFINPAMRPIFDNLAEDLWKEVTSA